MGEPALADVDRDGTADLIAEFAVFDDPMGLLTQPGTPAGPGGEAEKVLSGLRRIVAAVSGRSGKELWHRQIDREPVDLNQETLAHGVDYILQPKGPFVAVVNGTSQMALDPATGRVTTPALDLGFTPVGPIQYADLDGDGVMEVLALDRSKGAFDRALDRSDAGGVLDGAGKTSVGQEAGCLVRAQAGRGSERLASGGRSRQ